MENVVKVLFVIAMIATIFSAIISIRDGTTDDFCVSNATMNAAYFIITQ